MAERVVFEYRADSDDDTFKCECGPGLGEWFDASVMACFHTMGVPQSFRAGGSRRSDRRRSMASGPKDLGDRPRPSISTRRPRPASEMMPTI